MVTVLQYDKNGVTSYPIEPIWDNEADLHALCLLCIVAGGCDRIVVISEDVVLMDVSA